MAGSNAWDGSAGESEGWENSAGEGEAWNGPQGEQKDSADIGEGSMGPQDQYCSSYNQKKPLIEFGRFFTYKTCRQRNQKVNRVRKAKQKAIIRPQAIKE
jgi:hypothetical protein